MIQDEPQASIKKHKPESITNENGTVPDMDSCKDEINKLNSDVSPVAATSVPATPVYMTGEANGEEVVEGGDEDKGNEEIQGGEEYESSKEDKEEEEVKDDKEEREVKDEDDAEGTAGNINLSQYDLVAHIQHS